MAPPPAQDRYGRSSRHHNERDFDRFSPQRRRLTRRERLEMDLEQFEDDSASANSYDDEPMHRPPPHRYPRDYPPLPPPGNMWEWESGYSIHLPLKRRLEYHFPPPPFFLSQFQSSAKAICCVECPAASLKDVQSSKYDSWTGRLISPAGLFMHSIPFWRGSNYRVEGPAACLKKSMSSLSSITAGLCIWFLFFLLDLSCIVFQISAENGMLRGMPSSQS